MNSTTTGVCGERLANFENAFERLTWIMDQSDIPGTKKLILVCLMSYADIRTGECFPSIATLARVSGFSRTTINVGLKWLEANGYLSIEAHGKPKGDKDTSLYAQDTGDRRGSAGEVLP